VPAGAVRAGDGVATLPRVDADRRGQLDAAGYLVLRREIDPVPLSAEVDAVLRDAFAAEDHVNAGAVGNRFRYVPMMCERTPVSLDLVVRFAALAEELLGASVLPGRAKGTEYVGSTPWHRDADGAVRSIGIAAYLEPLQRASGGLQVRPGSHRGAHIGGAVALTTEPGDVVAFDERLFHASEGGGTRRQWRVDFVADVVDVADVAGGAGALRRYYADQYPSGWDGGYDVERYPSYGAHWRSIDERWNARLGALGAYAAAAAHEASVRRAGKAAGGAGR